MFSKLEEASKRLDELNALMADPDVAADHRKYQSYAKEVAGLRDLIDTYRQFKKVQEDIAASKELANDSDAEMAAMARDDLGRLTEQEKTLEQDLRLKLLPKDPFDGKNVIMEIRAGTGGDEAGLFAGDMYRMYMKYAEKNRWRAEVLSVSPAPQGGFKEVIILLSGPDVYSKLKFEGGGHRVQRVPQTETQGRVHTSACTVAILPEADDVEVKIENKDLKVDVYRSGGPGGQSVNTTDSAVRITHIPSGLVVVCQDEKSQIKNRSKAMKILKSRLLAQKQAEQDAAISAQRKSMVGTGDRSDRIRTYNFPQSRITDHRIGLTLYRLEDVIMGDLDEVINTLNLHDQSDKLKGGEGLKPGSRMKMEGDDD